MIVSASYRSDIPAFHASWFEAALEAGEATLRNPYSGAPIRVDLSPRAVDGYVFWTRNPRPFAAALGLVRAQNKPAIVQFTILAYPRALDARVPAPEDAIAQAQTLARQFGTRVIVWRYDPILLTPETEIDWHRRNFARLARLLAGSGDEVIVSFAQIYAKSRRNLTRAGLSWRDPEPAESTALILDLAAIAADFGFCLTLCAQPLVAAATGLMGARCIDPGRLSDLAGKEIIAAPPKRPNRPGCLCASARDIGQYDSCAHGCRYCYAVTDHDRAALRLKLAEAPFSSGARGLPEN